MLTSRSPGHSAPCTWPIGLTFAAALALGACGREDANNVATAQPGEAQEAAGDQTIAASLNQDGRFFQAARRAKAHNGCFRVNWADL